jgi:hypothetical protein
MSAAVTHNPGARGAWLAIFLATLDILVSVQNPRQS